MILFDRTPSGRELPWEARLTWEELETEGGKVTVAGGQGSGRGRLARSE